MLKKVILWFLVIGCMSLIFLFSSQEAPESKETSSGLITAVVRFFDRDCSISKTEMNSINEKFTFIVRKGAHFSIYALLGCFILLLLNEYKIYSTNSVFIASLISLIYACSDEIHQRFVAGRSGELRDVIIDFVGAIIGCLITVILKLIFRRKKNGLY